HGKAEFYINSTTGTCNIAKQYAADGAKLVMATKLPVSGNCEKVTDAAQAQSGVKTVAGAISDEFAAVEKAREERLNEWFGAFDAVKTGTASLGIREENNSVELLSAKIEVEDNKPSYIGIIAIALAVIAIAGAFVLWRKNGARSAVSALLCPVLLAGTVSLFGCEKTPVTPDTTDAPVSTEDTSDDVTDSPATDTPALNDYGKGWTLYGDAVKAEALKLSAPAFAFSDDKLFKNSRIELTFKFTEEGKVCFTAPVTAKDNDGLETTGYYFEADSEKDTVSVYYVTKNLRYPIGTKYCKMDVGVAYPVTIIFETLNTRRITFYLNENPLDEDPYPKYELVLDKKSSGQVGFACLQGKAEISLGGIKEFESTPKEGLTYTNPIITGMTDPDMFYHEGKYYLYGTRDKQSDHLYCYVSEDGVNFTDAGIVMNSKDVRGDKGFLTANILYHDGYFYIFYHANFNSGEGTGQCYAYATSPLGPFISDDKEATLYGRDDQIGGQPFVDEDGKIYLVHVRFGKGNETWCVEIECDKGKVTVKDETYTKLLEPTEDWENAIAPVVECGYLMKHNGLYYLIYAGGNYNSTYGVGFAVSEKLKGPYEKYEGNPVMFSNDQAYGAGAASVFPSLDGTEYFFVYLRHESSVSVRPINTAMDRFKFVKRADGYDIISVYGPTSTPQPAPSNNGTTTAGELDRFQDK
ncbi:MAG: family 43 glycosylhydrolase, partial [Clostridia bacterium]|nr:family 43 glycosylhydrolase [Clostridia bacterium]